MKKISFHTMDELMKQYSQKKIDAYAYIVYKTSNWPEENYSLESRTYKVKSTEKWFNPNMIGTSLYGDSLDNSDTEVNLRDVDWEIDYCYMDENNPKI